MRVLSVLLVLTAVPAVTSAQLAPSVPSDTAFVLARAGIVPENLVYDPARDRFLAGDLERDGLIELGRDGSIRAWATQAGIDGRVLGLRLDPRRQVVWGTAFTRPPAAASGDTAAPPTRSILFALALPDGRLVRRIESPQDGTPHLFNDLVLGRDGAVHFTDSEAGAVWTLRPGEAGPRLLHQGPVERFAYPNGIAWLPDERGLLIAHWQGLLTIELPSGRATPVRTPNDSAVGRIDGLYAACGEYVGIQNMANPSGIIAFRLAGGAVTAVRDLERGRPDFRGPTTGALVGDTLFYVANAQLGPFDPRPAGGTLAPVLVLRKPLPCEGGARR